MNTLEFGMFPDYIRLHLSHGQKFKLQRGKPEFHACAGEVLWRLEHRHMGSPGAICLISGVNDPGAVFALSGKVDRSPRVFAARDRDGLLRQMQAAALKRMGITIAG